MTASEPDRWGAVLRGRLQGIEAVELVSADEASSDSSELVELWAEPSLARVDASCSDDSIVLAGKNAHLPVRLEGTLVRARLAAA